MLLFSARPTEGRHEYEAKVTLHVKKLDEHGSAIDQQGSRPDDDQIKIHYDAIKNYISSNQAWSRGVKPHFFKIQSHKCAYCEMRLTDDGDVEHFRPKNAIFRLKARGQQLPNSNNVRGRAFWEYPDPETWDSGYWWLAYDWDNYFLSCGLCNRKWKNALFPIHGSHQRRPRRGDETREHHYLLDPYGSKDPADHLEFTVAGGVRPRNGSLYGLETIKVCGLDRQNLVVDRIGSASRTHSKLRQLLDAGTTAEQKRIFEDIESLGDEKEAHAGMVRAIFFQSTGWTWQQLLDWLATH